jgi:hypothetical protein
MKKIVIFLTILLLLVGCNSSSKKSKSTDIVDYFPKSDISKKFFTTKDNGDTEFYEEENIIKSDSIIVKVNNNIVREITINEDTLIEKDIDKNITKVLKRFLSKGDVFYTLPKVTKIEEIKIRDTVVGTKNIESKTTCKLENELDMLEDYDIKYYDDILKFKCIDDKKVVTHVEDDLPDWVTLTNGEEKSDYDVSYIYMKKEIGVISIINDDCVIKDKDGTTRINDNSKVCDEKHYSHTFYLK